MAQGPAINAPDVTDRVGRLLGIIASITAAIDVSDRAARLVGVVSQKPSDLIISVTAAANAGATATLPAAGAGLFHYITYIQITRNATAVLAGTATLVITTTNLPGSLAWSVGNAMVAGGTQSDVCLSFPSPIKSSVANIASTIVAPAPGAAVLWRINVGYYTGP